MQIILINAKLYLLIKSQTCNIDSLNNTNSLTAWCALMAHSSAVHSSTMQSAWVSFVPLSMCLSVHLSAKVLLMYQQYCWHYSSCRSVFCYCVRSNWHSSQRCESLCIQEARTLSATGRPKSLPLQTWHASPVKPISSCLACHWSLPLFDNPMVQAVRCWQTSIYEACTIYLFAFPWTSSCWAGLGDKGAASPVLRVEVEEVLGIQKASEHDPSSAGLCARAPAWPNYLCWCWSPWK